MLLSEPSKEKIEEWQLIWKEYKDKIIPNRKTGEELADYLTKKYSTVRVNSVNGMDISEMITLEITDNDFLSWKLPVGKKPEAVAFIIENKGEGKKLYNEQDEMFKGLEIFFVVDLITGCFHVEGSSALYDELKAVQGLDEMDLQNFFAVAEYVECRKKLNMDI